MSLAPLPEAIRGRLKVWLAVPWVDRGESLEGWDCWGLCRVVGAEAFGLVLPPFAGVVPTAEDQPAVAGAVAASLPRFREVAPAAGTVRLFASEGLLAHVGLHLTPRVVLHAVKGTGTFTVDLGDPRCAAWQRRARGAFLPLEPACG